MLILASQTFFPTIILLIFFVIPCVVVKWWVIFVVKWFAGWPVTRWAYLWYFRFSCINSLTGMKIDDISFNVNLVESRNAVILTCVPRAVGFLSSSIFAEIVRLTSFCFILY
jgi:ABC-type amino acid transport system permease subunit